MEVLPKTKIERGPPLLGGSLLTLGLSWMLLGIYAYNFSGNLTCGTPDIPILPWSCSVGAMIVAASAASREMKRVGTVLSTGSLLLFLAPFITALFSPSLIGYHSPLTFFLS
jgi:hypothetical protein